jgi:hypothetical protein
MVSYELATPGVIGEKFQEGMVVLNLNTGTYFDVGERMVPLFAAFEAGVGVAALNTGLEALEQGAGAQLSEAIARLNGFGLLREVPARTTDASSDLCAQILNGGKGFFIESHDDLAALIAADPIHDVDPVTGRLAG